MEGPYSICTISSWSKKRGWRKDSRRQRRKEPLQANKALKLFLLSNSVVSAHGSTKWAWNVFLASSTIYLEWRSSWLIPSISALGTPWLSSYTTLFSGWFYWVFTLWLTWAWFTQQELFFFSRVYFNLGHLLVHIKIISLRTSSSSSVSFPGLTTDNKNLSRILWVSSSFSNGSLASALSIQSQAVSVQILVKLHLWFPMNIHLREISQKAMIVMTAKIPEIFCSCLNGSKGGMMDHRVTKS